MFRNAMRKGLNMFNGDEFKEMLSSGEVKEVLNGLLFAVVAGVGGLVSYLNSLIGSRKKFVFGDFVIKGLSSAFAGLVIGWVMIYFQYPVTIIGAVTGVGGYLGADFTISLFQRFIMKKAGIEEKEKDE